MKSGHRYSEIEPVRVATGCEPAVNSTVQRHPPRPELNREEVCG